MSSVTLKDAQARLPELIEQLDPGEEITITSGGQPLAQVKRILPPRRMPRQAGNCKGMMAIVADDQDHLQDFAEYME